MSIDYSAVIGIGYVVKEKELIARFANKEAKRPQDFQYIFNGEECWNLEELMDVICGQSKLPFKLRGVCSSNAFSGYYGDFVVGPRFPRSDGFIQVQHIVEAVPKMDQVLLYLRDTVGLDVQGPPIVAARLVVY